MKKLNRFLPSPAMVIACVALFVAMGGSAAALATGVIDGREVKNFSLTGKDVKKDGLGGVTVKESRLGTVPRPPAWSAGPWSARWASSYAARTSPAWGAPATGATW